MAMKHRLAISTSKNGVVMYVQMSKARFGITRQSSVLTQKYLYT